VGRSLGEGPSDPLGPKEKKSRDVNLFQNGQEEQAENICAGEPKLGSVLREKTQEGAGRQGLEGNRAEWRR